MQQIHLLLKKILWLRGERQYIHSHNLPGKQERFILADWQFQSFAAILRILCALDETGFPINYSKPGHRPA
jgi:hypothetical protein